MFIIVIYFYFLFPASSINHMFYIPLTVNMIVSERNKCLIMFWVVLVGSLRVFIFVTKNENDILSNGFYNKPNI